MKNLSCGPLEPKFDLTFLSISFQLSVNGRVGISLVHRRMLRVRRSKLRLLRHQRKSMRDVQLRRWRRHAVAGQHFGRGTRETWKRGADERRRNRWRHCSRKWNVSVWNNVKEVVEKECEQWQLETCYNRVSLIMAHLMWLEQQIL